MTRKGLELPRTALLLLTVIFGLVDGEKWISINGEIGLAYTTSGQAVNIICTIAISEKPGAFILVNQAIWRAVGVSAELSPTSPQWSVVIDNLRRPGYTPDPARMSIWFGEHPSTTYMQIGLTIHVPFTSDSGIYFCNGSYVAQSNASVTVENSPQVHLSVTGTTQAATWITVNDWYFDSYFNTGLFPWDRIKLQCHSYVNDDSISIEGQYIFKYQSYLIDPRNGSSPYEYTTGSTRMEEYRNGNFTLLEILKLGPTSPTQRQMISGFDFGLSCSNTGMYSCLMRYNDGGNTLKFANASNFSVVVTDKPTASLYVQPKNEYGGLEDLYMSRTAAALSYATTEVVLVFTVKLFNEYPYFQVIVNNADVTSSLNISNYQPEVLDFNSRTSGFMGVKYRLRLTYSLPVTSTCRWEVTYRAWSPTIPSQSSTYSHGLITRSCYEKERGMALKSKASSEVVTSQKSKLIIWTMLSASLIQIFTA